MSLYHCAPLVLIVAAAGCGAGAAPVTPAATSTKSSSRPQAAAPAADSSVTPEQKLAKIFGGQKAVEIVQHAKTVQAFRVKGERSNQDPSKEIGGYEILSGPVDVTPEHSQALAKILTDPKSYHWEFAKSCEILPGVAIRFQSDQGTTDVLFCFECDIVAFCQNGKVIGGEDFDDRRGEILAIIKQIYPKDEEIQGLKENGNSLRPPK